MTKPFDQTLTKHCLTKHCVTKLNPYQFLTEPRPSPRFECYNAWSTLDPPPVRKKFTPASCRPEHCSRTKANFVPGQFLLQCKITDGITHATLEFREQLCVSCKPYAWRFHYRSPAPHSSPGQSGKPAVLDDALDEKMPR
jgi:hypothetical protein